MGVVYMALHGWKSCGDPESQPSTEAPRGRVTCQDHTAADSNLAFGGVRDRMILVPCKRFKTGRKVGGLVRIPGNEASLSPSSFHLLTTPVRQLEQ